MTNLVKGHSAPQPSRLQIQLQHKMLGSAIPSSCTGFPQLAHRVCPPSDEGETRYDSASSHHVPEGFRA
jgi:hypothetical protein